MLIDGAGNVDLFERAEDILERDHSKARRRLREERGNGEQLVTISEIIPRAFAQDQAQALLPPGARLVRLARIDPKPALGAPVMRLEPAAQATQTVRLYLNTRQ